MAHTATLGPEGALRAAACACTRLRASAASPAVASSAPADSAARGPASAGERCAEHEQTDPARRDGLDERERRETEGAHVERPPEQPEHESREPASRGEEDAHARERDGAR